MSHYMPWTQPDDAKNDDKDHEVNSKPAERAKVDKDSFYVDGVREVGVYISVLNLGSVNTVDQTFETTFEMQMNWACTKEELEMYEKDPLNYKPSWVPRYIFPTGKDIDNKHISKKDDTGYRILKVGCEDAWGNVVKDFLFPYVNDALFNVSGTFVENLELENFPVDVQDLTIIVESQESINSVVFCPSYDFSASAVEVSKKRISLPEFTVEDPIVEFSVHKYDIFHSCLNVRLKVKRKFAPYIHRVLLFLSIIALASLAAFSLDPIANLQDRLSLLYTMMLTAVAFQFVVSTSLPVVPYITLMDLYCLFCFVYVFALIVEVALIGYLEAPTRTDNICFWLSLAAFILFHVWYIIKLIRAVKIEDEKLQQGEREYEQQGLISSESSIEVPHEDTRIHHALREIMTEKWNEKDLKYANVF